MTDRDRCRLAAVGPNVMLVFLKTGVFAFSGLNKLYLDLLQFVELTFNRSFDFVIGERHYVTHCLADTVGERLLALAYLRCQLWL